MADIDEHAPLKKSRLSDEKVNEKDEVVFRFDQAEQENKSYMSLADYGKIQPEKQDDLLMSKALLCMASPVFKTMLGHESKFEESKGVIRICDFPRRSYLAFYNAIHPTILKEPSRKFYL